MPIPHIVAVVGVLVLDVDQESTIKVRENQIVGGDVLSEDGVAGALS